MALEKWSGVVCALIFWSSVGSSVALATTDPRWTTEKVAPSASGNRQVALKLASNGNVHLAFTGCTDKKCNNNELFYSVRTPNGKWTSTAVDSDGDNTGEFVSMVLTADDNPHLFYSNHNKQPILRHAFKSHNGWAKEVIGTKPGGFWTSATVSGDAIYVANTSFPTSDINVSVMQVATHTRDGWTFEDIDSSGSSGWFTTLVIGPDGLPIATFTQGVFPDGDLMLARKLSTGKWETSNVDHHSYKASMLVDAKGFYHLAYTKIDEKFMKTTDLMYATTAPDGLWHMTKVEGGDYAKQDTGLFPNLKMDSQGGLHIVYGDKFHEKVVYARNLGDGWKIYPVTLNKDDGHYFSMEIDALGGVHVAYDSDYEIRYLYCADCAIH